jgi:hypothetical protein
MKLSAGENVANTPERIGAQLAVDAAMMSFPEITRLYGTPKSDAESDLVW